MTEGGSPRYVFHLTARAAYAAAFDAGVYEAPSLISEGFIHCSTGAQIARTAERFYRARSGLVILCLEAEKLGAALKYEPAHGELFPHVYGGIAVESIVAVIDFPCRADGGFDLPEELAVFG